MHYDTYNYVPGKHLQYV